MLMLLLAIVGLRLVIVENLVESVHSTSLIWLHL